LPAVIAGKVAPNAPAQVWNTAVKNPVANDLWAQRKPQYEIGPKPPGRPVGQRAEA
jgi:hypothetical protein